MKVLNRRQSGFTIIEVMIVLAIAGVIMLALFLAVPALQRNSRNNQRNSDAALVSAAINECLNSRNGQVSSCDTLAEVSPTYLDTTKLRQLTTVSVSATAPSFPSDTGTAAVGFVAKCSSDGATISAGTARQFTVAFNTESTSGGNVNRCLES